MSYGGIYYRGKIVGGIYEDKLLVKSVKSEVSYMPIVPYELSYEGAKEMLLVDEVGDKEFLTGLLYAMYDEIPALKAKKRNKPNSVDKNQSIFSGLIYGKIYL